MAILAPTVAEPRTLKPPPVKTPTVEPPPIKTLPGAVTATLPGPIPIVAAGEGGASAGTVVDGTAVVVDAIVVVVVVSAVPVLRSGALGAVGGSGVATVGSRCRLWSEIATVTTPAATVRTAARPTMARRESGVSLGIASRG